mmetsp:Transcript_63005/g.150079  ORF Transcript_63005/g.150079 Transcript_63005/m.150079 type:complete len:524 (-) Transcript_63005:763-2334(-)
MSNTPSSILSPELASIVHGQGLLDCRPIWPAPPPGLPRAAGDDHGPCGLVGLPCDADRLMASGPEDTGPHGEYPTAEPGTGPPIGTERLVDGGPAPGACPRFAPAPTACEQGDVGGGGELAPPLPPLCIGGGPGGAPWLGCLLSGEGPPAPGGYRGLLRAGLAGPELEENGLLLLSPVQAPWLASPEWPHPEDRSRDGRPDAAEIKGGSMEGRPEIGNGAAPQGSIEGRPEGGREAILGGGPLPGSKDGRPDEGMLYGWLGMEEPAALPQAEPLSQPPLPTEACEDGHASLPQASWVPFADPFPEGHCPQVEEVLPPSSNPPKAPNGDVCCFAEPFGVVSPLDFFSFFSELLFVGLLVLPVWRPDSFRAARSSSLDSSKLGLADDGKCPPTGAETVCPITGPGESRSLSSSRRAPPFERSPKTPSVLKRRLDANLDIGASDSISTADAIPVSLSSDAHAPPRLFAPAVPCRGLLPPAPSRNSSTLVQTSDTTPADCFFMASEPLHSANCSPSSVRCSESLAPL